MIKFWFSHWCACNMVAIKHNVWSLRYLLHDVDKIFLYMWYKYIKNDPAPIDHATRVHKENSSHHIECLDRLGRNWVNIVINWESKHINNPVTVPSAYNMYIINYHQLTNWELADIKSALMKTGLWEGTPE